MPGWALPPKFTLEMRLLDKTIFVISVAESALFLTNDVLDM
jgi:hypothetical protein